MTKDMTTGAITPLLVKFTIPLVLGNLFQLTYNAADSIIVGKFVGEDALAAVGTSNPLMTLAILFINGLCLGAGILVSTAYGAGDTQRVERQVSTTAIAGTVFSLVFSALCVLLATPLLRLMQVPEEILPIAVQYLRIVFAGLIFTFFYNFLAASLPTKSTDTRNTRVTKWAALAFASQAALYEGTYRKYHGLDNYEKYLEIAASTARQFIDESGFSLYKEGTEPYRDMFCADNAKTTEVVLARAYNFEGLQLSHSVQFSIANLQMGFTRRFMNHYLMADGTRFTDKQGYETMFYTDEVKNRDPRLQQTVLCPNYIQKGETTVTANDLTAYCGYRPIKFVGTKDHDGAAKSTSDWPLMRAAEVYLNYAEAKAELGTLKQEDLDISINKIRERAKMPDLNLTDANSNPDPYLAACYPNVEQGTNKGVILEIRRERTIELVMEGLRQWDLFRWKEGKQMFNHYVPYYGIYVPGVGTYDMDGDGKPDLEIYETTATSQCDNKKKLDKDIYLSNGTSGYIIGFPKVTYGKDWKEERDYLWPVPADQRVLTQGILTQNPGWEDGLSY